MTPNEYADLWYNEIGGNVFPANSKEKKPYWTDNKGEKHYISWSEYQETPITEAQFKEWKESNAFKNGLAVICGEVFRGKNKGLWINGIDCDNQKGIDELRKTVTLKQLASVTLVEQHSNKSKAHIYYLTKQPIKSKSGNKEKDENGNSLPQIEIKSGGKQILYCAGGHHKDNSLIEIVGIKEIKQVDKEALETNLNNTCVEFSIPYLSGISTSLKPIEELTDKKFEIHSGENRSEAILRYSNSKFAKNREFDENTLFNVNMKYNHDHCKPPYPESKVRSITKQSINFISEKNTVSPEINKQLKENWEILKNEPTKKEKISTQKKINDLQKLAGYEETDWDEEKKTEKKKLYELALTKIEKIIISKGNKHEVYAIVKIDEHYEPILIGGSRSIYWLNDLIQKNMNTNTINSKSFFEDILDTITAKAQIENIDEDYTYNRIAYKDNKIYYYLGNNDYEVIVISENGIDKIKIDVDTPIFTQNQTTTKQSEPIYDDSNALDEFTKLLQIKDKQLFKVHLVSMFLEHIPVPIMLFDGKAGSFKTTITSMIKRIVDPSGDDKDSNVVSIPSKNDELIMTMYHRCVSVFENVSKIDNEISDIFCRSVTGSSNIKRGLYTNLEEIILTFKRKIIINGITPNLDNGDLQQRIISYDRENSNFISEGKLKIIYDDLKPRVLGQIFNILQQVLTEIELFDYTAKTRMADFERWGELISQKLGYPKDSFLNVYESKMESIAISGKDSHPIIEIIESIMADRGSFKGAMRDLFTELKNRSMSLGIDTQSKYVRFPKASNQLSKELVLISPILDRLGLSVKTWNNTEDNNYGKNVKLVEIKQSQKLESVKGEGLFD